MVHELHMTRDEILGTSVRWLLKIVYHPRDEKNRLKKPAPKALEGPRRSAEDFMRLRGYPEWWIERERARKRSEAKALEEKVRKEQVDGRRGGWQGDLRHCAQGGPRSTGPA
jgi:hypothetical protein